MFQKIERFIVLKKIVKFKMFMLYYNILVNSQLDNLKSLIPVENNHKNT